MLQKIIHFNVKEGKAKKFQKWIVEHQENYAKALPSGWKYLDGNENENGLSCFVKR